MDGIDEYASETLVAGGSEFLESQDAHHEIHVVQERICEWQSQIGQKIDMCPSASMTFGVMTNTNCRYQISATHRVSISVLNDMIRPWKFKQTRAIRSVHSVEV